MAWKDKADLHRRIVAIFRVKHMRNVRGLGLGTVVPTAMAVSMDHSLHMELGLMDHS